MKPQLINVDVDRLTLMFDIKDYNHIQEIEAKVLFLQKKFYEPTSPFKNKYSSERTGYKHSLTLPLAGKVPAPDKDGDDIIQENKTFLIQVLPFGKNRRFMRVDISDYPLKLEDYFFIRFWLSFLLGINYKNFYKASETTKVDIAADFKNVSPDDIFVSAKQLQTSALFFGRNGQIETHYIGNRGGNRQITIYDFVANQKRKGFKTSDSPITRVEPKLNPKRSIKEIPKIANPFKGIKIYSFSQLMKLNSIHPDTIDAIHRRGLTAYIQRLPKSERKHFTDLIESCEVDWLKPTDIWEKWEKSVKKLLALKPKLTKNKQSFCKKFRKVFDNLYKDVIDDFDFDNLGIDEQYLSDLSEEDDFE